MLLVVGYANLCLEPLDVEARTRQANGSWDGNNTFSPPIDGAFTPGDKKIAAPRGPTAVKLKVPRPPNEWILYRADNHLPIKEAYPGITNNEICKFPVHFALHLYSLTLAYSFDHRWHVGCRNSAAAHDVQSSC